MLRMVVAGGGTGGHLYAGIAVAREAIREGGEVLFIGDENGLEARVLPREGLVLKAISAGKFRGMGLAGKLRTLSSVPRGVSASIGILKGFGPDVVLGVGGYASFPAVAAAVLMRIPVVIQEQNAVPGLANRVLSKGADAVAIGFEEAAGFFPKKKTTFTGNPIRAGLLGGGRKEAARDMGLDPGKPTVLVFGGSAGAHRINQAVTGALGLMKKAAGNVQFIHVSGEKDKGTVEAAYADAGIPASVHSFIYDMSGPYACADLVVCRAGALTLAEVTALGKPAVLIPYPFAAGGHQMSNAMALQRAGAARVVPDDEADGPRLAAEIEGLITNDVMLTGMAGRSLSMGRAGSAARVLGICKEAALRLNPGAQGR